MAYIYTHSGHDGGNDDRSGSDGDDGHAAAAAEDEGAEREAKARAAMFYSINATQPGLRGVELGNHLIKRVRCGGIPK